MVQHDSMGVYDDFDGSYDNWDVILDEIWSIYNWFDGIEFLRIFALINMDNLVGLFGGYYFIVK